MQDSLTNGWTEFLVTAAGASAALAGLLFVAISINLTRIIELPGVSGRAAETIMLLSYTLAASLVALIPHLSATQLGSSWLFLAIPTCFVPIGLQVQSIRHKTYIRPFHIISRIVLYQLAALPGVLAGLLLLVHAASGMLWFAGGAVASMLVAIGSAWVLLVEILR